MAAKVIEMNTKKERAQQGAQIKLRRRQDKLVYITLHAGHISCTERPLFSAYNISQLIDFSKVKKKKQKGKSERLLKFGHVRQYVYFRI